MKKLVGKLPYTYSVVIVLAVFERYAVEIVIDIEIIDVIY